MLSQEQLEAAVTQSWIDLRKMIQDEIDKQNDGTWTLARSILSERTTPNRIEFLNDVIGVALTHGSYAPWCYIKTYSSVGDSAKDKDFAVILEVKDEDDEMDGKEGGWIFNHEEVERALLTIRRGEVSGLADNLRRDILWSDLHNEAQIDVIAGLAILETAMFGEVRYA